MLQSQLGAHPAQVDLGRLAGGTLACFLLRILLEGIVTDGATLATPWH
jgi:hypothetical protein